MKTALVLAGFLAACIAVCSGATCKDIGSQNEDFLQKIFTKKDISLTLYMTLRVEGVCEVILSSGVSDKKGFTMMYETTSDTAYEFQKVTGGGWNRITTVEGRTNIEPIKVASYAEDGDNSYVCIYSCEEKLKYFRIYDCYVYSLTSTSVKKINKELNTAKFELKTTQKWSTCNKA